ncbi:PIF-1 [Alphabaculovirus myunipunctae]|uniref:PIF-1 n=1 Tax=Mythimna unipuncta nucleopolyhedrovirus TaxID=447897 RepID=A0A2K9VS50_9ABAC|nr:PIF-1 [Mythimna unipuncta nucleopolyhedrovirus]AUV65286.1 PIF-1 [Mythimna unipuncta nucleopolyhedrovirus]
MRVRRRKRDARQTRDQRRSHLHVRLDRRLVRPKHVFVSVSGAVHQQRHAGERVRSQHAVVQLGHFQLVHRQRAAGQRAGVVSFVGQRPTRAQLATAHGDSRSFHRDVCATVSRQLRRRGEDMYLIVAIVLLVFIVLILYNYIGLLEFAQVPPPPPLLRYNNDGVSFIEPPTEIIIEGNDHECHKQLTPCTTHMDCDVCREGLANCQYFESKTLVTMRDPETNQEVSTEIEAGESYCMALDRERARSCNPHTGVWLLAQSETGYSLLCSCLMPGLVTQLSLYHDCDVPVGCQPNGQIASIYETPLRCVCDTGFESDFDATTQTPYCRSRRFRDLVFHRLVSVAPCGRGEVQINHPALDPLYLEQVAQPDICVIDPCSVDPISGQRHNGYLSSQFIDGTIYNFCVCPYRENLFGIYNNQPNMIRDQGRPLVNACLRPFNSTIAQLFRVDYKVFWAHNDRNVSDDELVALVQPVQMSSPRYHRMLFPPTLAHPDVGIHHNFQIFKISMAFSPIFYSNDNIYTKYIVLSARTREPCFFPGHEGRCIVANANGCIRRHAPFQVGTAQASSNHWCYLSRDGGYLLMWWWADHLWRRNEYAVAMRMPLLFAFVENNRWATTINLVRGFQIDMPNFNHDAMRQILDTYVNYSVN